MAARKSKSAKSRRTPKKTNSKGGKTAARAKATERSVTERKKTAQKKSKPSKVQLAEVIITKPAQRKPRTSNGLAPLLSRLRAELGPDHQPAWLVDAAAASLIPINDAGACLFDVNANEMRAVALDQSMPALATLRKLDGKRTDKTAGRRSFEELLFWTPTGVHTHDCQITAHTVKGRTFFLVQSKQNVKPEQRHRKDQSIQGTAEPPKSPPRDDAAILREIARRIRAGTNSQPVIDDIPGELPTPQYAPPSFDPIKVGASADRTKDALLDRDQRAKLAHELRTPISAIIAASEIIKDERLGSLDNFHYRDYARDIHQSARHALELIEQGLKTIADSTPEPPSPRADRADLNHLVRSAVATIKHLAQKKNISVAFVPGERDACLEMDPTAVTQIVLNLLTNAVKFTESGGSVTAQVFSNLGEDIFVEVRDTGCGMSRSEIDHHLHARSRLTPQARPGGGSGIGLPLSRKLANENGASLELESTPGHGTTARLAFPLRRLVAV